MKQMIQATFLLPLLLLLPAPACPDTSCSVEGTWRYHYESESGSQGVGAVTVTPIENDRFEVHGRVAGQALEWIGEGTQKRFSFDYDFEYVGTSITGSETCEISLTCREMTGTWSDSSGDSGTSKWERIE